MKSSILLCYYMDRVTSFATAVLDGSSTHGTLSRATLLQVSLEETRCKMTPKRISFGPYTLSTVRVYCSASVDDLSGLQIAIRHHCFSKIVAMIGYPETKAKH